ncbi:MAG: amidase [Gemmatimonadetes bacterium]|nr:amidase [Gemmatimonadota bacterium]
MSSCSPSAERADGAPAAVPPFALEEATVADLQARMVSGELSAARITELYLERIAAVDRAGPTINSVLVTNPDARALAARADSERAAGKVRGPLHGIPVLLKDNIDTADQMRTTAGSLALAESTAARDAGLVARLREAGAVILGKVNLSEWANIRSNRSTSGWSAVGGLTKNPYALDRNACGSSAGTGAAIAANLACVGIGTETDGSIVCPANANGLVGIKPTVGLVSRAGIVPISHTQDTAGPMCRTVRDAAALLSVVAGADPRDGATSASAGHVLADYTTACDAAALKGARIGVVRQLFNAGPQVNAVMVEALDALQAAGAVLVDPVDIPSLNQLGDAEFTVLLHELKADMAAYLATCGPNVPHRSLADLIRFNEANRAVEMAWFGQEVFEMAEQTQGLDALAYRVALGKCQRLTRTDGLDRVLADYKVDALLAPTGGPAWVTDLVNGDHFGGGSSQLSAVSGYPAITVPAGQISGLPVGFTLMGPAWSEARLIGYAFAFEQVRAARRPPAFLPTVVPSPVRAS